MGKPHTTSSESITMQLVLSVWSTLHDDSGLSVVDSCGCMGVSFKDSTINEVEQFMKNA